MTDTDIALLWNQNNGYADFQISSTNPQLLESNQDLLTSVTISLLADRLAHITDHLPIPNSKDRRGWWGDTFLVNDPLAGGIIGSRLWLLSRASSTNETLKIAKGYAEEALDWLITRKIASKLNITTSWLTHNPPQQLLKIAIEIVRGGSPTIDLTYALAWQQISNPSLARPIIPPDFIPVTPPVTPPTPPGQNVYSNHGYGDGQYGEVRKAYSDGSYAYGAGNYDEA